MPKEKVSIGYRVSHWFTYHPWLKLVALILAVVAWFYIRTEMRQ